MLVYTENKHDRRLNLSITCRFSSGREVSGTEGKFSISMKSFSAEEYPWLPFKSKKLYIQIMFCKIFNYYD